MSKLQSTWLWQFQVKTLARYGQIAFSQSYCTLQQETNDYEELIKVTNNIPPLNEQFNSNIALFRDKIKNEWEDPENQNAFIIELKVNRCELTDPTENQKRFCTLEKEKLNALFVGITALVLNHEKKQINGLYVKTKEDSFVFQLWVKQEGAEEVFQQMDDFYQMNGIDKGLAKYQLELKKVSTSTPKKELAKRQFSASISKDREFSRNRK
ncbi:Eukaryotic_initiation factor 4E [Hexamita inflata]|uniref:Eukaryotic_initiation factor 4E n=1 Tax=Hexamita inflata TaxID=28002 RepID=A0ABP1IAQ8_9EUKA